MSSSNYEKYRDKLLSVKKLIDSEIKNNKISQNLLRYEVDLNEYYKQAINTSSSPQDKKFINFNYYPCKAMISLAKEYKYIALIELLNGFKAFIEYITNLRIKNKWNKSFEYFTYRFNLIFENEIEIFGNLSQDKFNKIISNFKEILRPNTNNEIQPKIYQTIIDCLFKIIRRSGNIYTDEHLNRSEEIIDILTNNFSTSDSYLNGLRFQIIFIILKKELHFYIRKHMNSKDTNLEKSIKEIILRMERIAGKSKNSFNKVKNNGNIEFKKFLAKIDALTTEYYKYLWVEKDLKKASKQLEEIFMKIRKNWKIISTPSLFLHFTSEFLFLQNYVKLLLLANDFKAFSLSKNAYDWQKSLMESIAENLFSIAQENFKYGVCSDTGATLIIAEKGVSGKFLEFIIFYLLKEITSRADGIVKELNKNNNKIRKEIKDLLKVIGNSKPEDIKWSFKISNTDIDISIKNEYAILVKTGLIGSKDKKKIKNELNACKSYKIFYILDIAKNLETTKELLIYNNKINIIDVGEFIDTVYDLAKNLGIDIELSKSSIKAFSKF